MDTLISKFTTDFIEQDRWKLLVNGFENTVVISIFAALLGIIIGFFIAVVRTSYEKDHRFPVLNAICKAYLTIIRGTPSVIQLMIMFYIVFASMNNKVVVAILAFGINSGAYVAEIIRSGIMSVDAGQFEAGRSLGFTYAQTMRYIITPQAFKNCLPSLGNEFITLIKETSICGYIGLQDLTRGGDIIRATTYDPFMPLIGVALIYLIIVVLLTAGLGKLERRMRRNER